MIIFMMFDSESKLQNLNSFQKVSEITLTSLFLINFDKQLQQNHLKRKPMQFSLCEQHEQPKTIIDLDRFETICPRCALFNPLYQRHQFLEAEHIEEHTMKQVNQLQTRIRNITVEGQWKEIKNITAECLGNKLQEINSYYDQIICDLEKERRQTIQDITDSMKAIESDCKGAAQGVIRGTVDKLQKVNLQLGKLVISKDYLQIEKIFAQKEVFSKIKSIEKEMQIIIFDLHQKVKDLSLYSFKEVTLKKKKISVMEELLLNNEEENQFLSMELSSKSDHLTCGSNCQTQLSFCDPTLELPSFKSDSKLDKSHLSLDENKKRTKTLFNKAQIKNLHIRNDIRNVNLCQLSLTNREAFQAIKKSTNNTFVSRIDLSHNNLTSQLILMLKRQKNNSKYLKTILVKGIKIDQKSLTKEGIPSQAIKSGKFQFGNITIEL